MNGSPFLFLFAALACFLAWACYNSYIQSKDPAVKERVREKSMQEIKDLTPEQFEKDYKSGQRVYIVGVVFLIICAFVMVYAGILAIKG